MSTQDVGIPSNPQLTANLTSRLEASSREIASDFLGVQSKDVESCCCGFQAKAASADGTFHASVDILAIVSMIGEIIYGVIDRCAAARRQAAGGVTLPPGDADLMAGQLRNPTFSQKVAMRRRVQQTMVAQKSAFTPRYAQLTDTMCCHGASKDQAYMGALVKEVAMPDHAWL